MMFRSKKPKQLASRVPPPPPPQPRRLPLLSRYSTPVVPDSLWFSSDFLVGAGLAIIQPSTAKVVLVNDTEGGSWFLPKGRKDLNETIEAAALREAYEESGYRASFLPLYLPSRQPSPPSPDKQYQHKHRLCTSEPIYVDVRSFGTSPDALPLPPNRRFIHGGEYLTFWFVGEIGETAIAEEGTGMPDEVDYKSSLLEYSDAVEKLTQYGSDVELWVLELAYSSWKETVRIQAEERMAEERIQAEKGPSPESSGGS